MSTRRLPRLALGRGSVCHPSRQPRRFALACEPLEDRQLLSTVQVTFPIVAGGLNPAIVKPNAPVSPLASTSAPAGLSPSQLRQAYGVNQIAFGAVAGNGAGQTIAII